MARGDQMGRQWKILQKISGARNGKSVAELTSELECQRRTVYRDIEALQNAGFPLYNEKEDGRSKWFLLDSSKGSIDTPFSITELMALYFGRDLLKALDGTFLSSSLQSLVEKIKSKLPEDSLNYLSGIEKTFQISARPSNFGENIPALIKDINDAALSLNYLFINYNTISRDEITKRKISPYKILFHEGTYYLIAYCTLRKSVRTFSLERIKSWQISDEKFEQPEDFDVDEYTSRSFGVFQGTKTKVIIKFSKSVAKIIAEKRWHESQKISWEEDGSMIFEVEVAGTDEVKNWLMKWGHQAVVMEPVDLRDKIKNDVLLMIENYS